MQKTKYKLTMKIINLWMFCVLLSSAFLFVQTQADIIPSYHVSTEVVKKGEEVTLIFILKFSNKWKVYSNIQDYDIGPLPTSFNFEAHASYELLGGVLPVGSKREHDPVFEVDVNFFALKAEFHQRIKVSSDTILVKGNYQYQLCDSLDGRCAYDTEDFEFNIISLN